ncbi:MAG: monovalent cation/H+ antiporter complex subunit F [Bacillota bacterium]
MLRTWFLLVSVALALLAFLSFYRAVIGPTPADRIIAINVIGTKTVVILAMMGFVYEEEWMFVDVALVYALISFVATVGVAKYFRKGRLS